MKSLIDKKIILIRDFKYKKMINSKNMKKLSLKIVK